MAAQFVPASEAVRALGLDALLHSTLTAAPVARATGAPAPSDPHYAAVTLSQLASPQAETKGALSTNRLNADVMPAPGSVLASIDGTLDLTDANATAVDQTSVIRPSGGMAIADQVGDGQPAPIKLSVQRTEPVARLPMPIPVGRGA